jgi:hypothetical protein
MTITLDIPPAVEAELARQASAHGRAMEAYAASLLENAVGRPSGDLTSAEKRKHEGRKSLVEICAMVRGLTEDLDFTRNSSTGRPLNLS